VKFAKTVLDGDRPSIPEVAIEVLTNQCKRGNVACICGRVNLHNPQHFSIADQFDCPPNPSWTRRTIHLD
jgi:hypothetical protein